jgi:hypothetical protein
LSGVLDCPIGFYFPGNGFPDTGVGGNMSLVSLVEGDARHERAEHPKTKLKAAER